MLACLLARLCGCFAVVAGGLKKTTSLRNGKVQKLLDGQGTLGTTSILFIQSIIPIHSVAREL